MIRFSETEIRNSAKEAIEALEHWSRRIINEIFSDKYGTDYFTYKLENGDSIIKSEIGEHFHFHVYPAVFLCDQIVFLFVLSRDLCTDFTTGFFLVLR